MAKRTLRQAIIVYEDVPVSVIVFPPNEDGDAYLASYDGVCVVPDFEDEYGKDFLTLTGCVAVEVTGMDPMPGVGNGWTYIDGEFVPPATKEPIDEQGAD